MHAPVGGDVPGAASGERPPSVRPGRRRAERLLAGGRPLSQAPRLRSPAAGACAGAACCTAHPDCNPTPPCDVLAAPVTSGLRVLHTDPPPAPTPPHPTPGAPGSARGSDCRPGPAVALGKLRTSPETQRGAGRGGAGGSLKERRVSGSTEEHAGGIHRCAGGAVAKGRSTVSV